MNPDGHAQTHFNSDYPIAFQGAHVDVMNIAEENYVQVGAHYLPSGFMDVIRYSIGHELFHVIGGRHQNPAPLTPETDPDAVRQRILADLNGLAAGADAELDSDGDGFPDWLEGLLCSDPFNDGSTPLRHDGSAAMFPVTVEVKAVPATPAVLAVGSRRLLIDRTGTWTFWLDEGAAWPVSLWSAQGGWVRLSLTAGGGCAAFQPGGAGAAAFGDGMTLPPGAPVAAGLIAQPLVAVRAPTAARERGGTVCFHSAGRKSLAAKITPPMRGAYAWRLSGTPLPGNRPHVNLTMPKSGALGLSFTAEGASAAKTDWVDIHTCILPEEPAPAWCLAHDCEDALCACDHGNSSPVWCFLHNCDVSECSPPPVCPRHGCPYPECPADWCHEHDCTRDACARLHDPGSGDPDEPGDPGPGGDPGEPDEPDHPPWGRNENILLILNADDDDGDLQEDREQAPWTADGPDPDLAPLAPLGSACCQCPGHGWAEEPGAELASASSRVRLWRDTGKQTAFSGSIMQSQRVYAEGLAPSPGPWADALVWHWTEAVHDGHASWQRHHYATNRVTVLGVALMPDADGDGAVASALPGAPDHAVLVLSSNRTWHVGVAGNALKKVRLSAYVGAGVPGTLRLHASGDARFRVWPAPASTNGTPLLSLTGSPDDVSDYDFPDRFTDLEVYAEFLGPGDAELTFEFYGPKYDRRHRFRAEATQKIRVYARAIDFLVNETVVTNSLQVAKWESAFSNGYVQAGSYIVTNAVFRRSEFISADADRFRVRVTDERRADAGAVEVALWTEHPGDSTYNAASRVMTLPRVSPGVFASTNLLLVSDWDDAHFNTTAYGVAPNSTNRLFLSQLLSNMCGLYVDGWGQTNVFSAPVGVDVKSVGVDVAIMRTNGVACIDTLDALVQVTLAKERFAQANITVEMGSLVFFDAPPQVDPDNWYVVSTNDLRMLSPDARSVVHEALASVTNGANNRCLIFVPSIRDTPNHQVAGLATAKYRFIYAVDRAYTDHCLISASQIAPFVSAHELCHALGVHAHVSDKCNLMFSTVTPFTDVSASKRLYIGQTRAMRLGEHVQ